MKSIILAYRIVSYPPFTFTHAAGKCLALSLCSCGIEISSLQMDIYCFFSYNSSNEKTLKVKQKCLVSYVTLKNVHKISNFKYICLDEM